MSANFMTITRGSCLSAVLTFRDKSGQEIDVSEMDIDIFEPNRPAFQHLEITKLDPIHGKVRLHLESEYVLQLGMGNTNRFRVICKPPLGCEQSSKKIEVKVE